MGCNSDSVPLALDLVDGWIGGVTYEVAKAVRIKIGTPAQTITVFPRIDFDDISVSNSLIHFDNSVYPYPTGREELGLYNWTKSSTAVKVNQTHWNGTDNNYDDTLTLFFEDAVQLGDGLKLEGFPILSESTAGGWGFNTLPLFGTSVFLNSLVKTGQIISTVVGFWPGTRGTLQGVEPQFAPNNSLVLGGYDGDLARVTDQKQSTTIKFDPENCPYCVNVTAITYNAANKAFDLLTTHDDPLLVTMTIESNYLNFPQAAYQSFGKATNATYNATLMRYTYPSHSVPDGNLTVTLSNGYKTTIPTEELFTPLVSLASSGTITESKDAYIAMFGNSTIAPDTPGPWGRPYLSMNYLVADISRSQMILSPIVSQGFTGRSLYPICDLVKSSGNSTEAPHPGQSQPQNQSRSHSHAGAIAGGVIGGILGALLLLGSILFWRRRRRRQRAADLEGDTGANERAELEGDGQGVDPDSPEKAKVAPLATRQELDANEIYETAVKEKPTELSPEGTTPPVELPSGETPAYEMEGDTPREKRSQEKWEQ